MKQNRKTALALMLAAMLLTLSGCTGVEDGTIDYIDGHWVFTEAQTGQSMDMTQSLTDPAALAAVWPTLTTQEQLMALSNLSSEEYEALRALLDGEANPEPTPEPTLAPTFEQIPEPTSEPTPAPTDIQLIAEPTPVPQETASAQEPEATPSASPDAERTSIALPTDPTALAEIWFTLSPQEQMSAIAALTAEQFVALRELTAEEPRPTPVEEDLLFIPSPKPTAKKTPVPTVAPTNPPAEAGAETAEPDLTDMTDLAGIWHTLSPQEQLSMLSSLTIEQYIALQEHLARLSNADGDIPNNEVLPSEEVPAEQPEESDETDGDASAPEEEAPAEQPEESDETDGDASEPEEEAPAEQPEESDETDGDASAPEGEAPAEQPEASDPIDLAYLVSIWPTLSPGEQLSILSTLSSDQYNTLQQLLARRLESAGEALKAAEQIAEQIKETMPEEKPDESEKAPGDESAPQEDGMMPV